jgi:hypothetical protein
VGDIEKFSNQIIDYAERLADVADAAKGKGMRRSGLSARWIVLPAAGAGLYALATSRSFTRHTKDVVEQAKARASDLPEDLLNRVQDTSSSGTGRSRGASRPKSRSGASNSARRTGNSRKKSGSTSRSRSTAR